MTIEENSIKYSIDAGQQIKEKDYWLDKLSGEPVKTFFPYDRKPTGEMRARFDSQTFEYRGEIFEKLLRLSNNSDIRLHIILLTVLAGILHKYTANTDVTVGAPVKKQEIEGEFLNTVLILRNQLHGNLTFKDVLLNLSQTLGEANEHVNYPINTLFYQLNIPYSEGESPLFDVALFLKNLHDKKDIQHLNLNMTFGFYRKDRSLEGEIEYNSSLYRQSTIRQITSHFKIFLTAVLSDIDRTLETIDILGEAGKNRLLFDFNRTASGYPADKVIHQLFTEQVERTPHHIALIGFNAPDPEIKTNSKYQVQLAQQDTKENYISISYRELSERSNRLARFLTQKGLSTDGIAALLVDRSIEMIIGILAVLKAGGGYLPIDPDYPADRVRYMLEDSNADMLLTTKNLSPGNTPFNKDIVYLEDEKSYKRDRSNLETTAGPADLCYIIYTSGTTGNPKGVMISHENVVRLMFNDDYLFDFEKTDVWTMFHSYCFDFSVWEMYGSLLYGGKLLLVTKMITRDPGIYQKILVEERVSVLNQTPSGFKNLISAASQSLQKQLNLKYVIFGGEALSPIILKEWKSRYPKTKFINMYGITETTVHVTYKEIRDAEIEMNDPGIGTPIPTLTAYIMNGEQGLLPIGAPGEIYVGGKGVARGYLNRPELTGEKFIKNPYIPEERLYRTGDRGRLLENGEMEYAGRVDNQVKIRGHRIELKELEHQMLKLAPVKDAAVLVHEDKNAERQLTAYVVPHPEHCYPVRRFLQLEKQGISKNQQHFDLPNGMTVFYLNRAETDFMYGEIFEKHSYLKEWITLEEGACVFDVGANIGIFSLYVRNMCKRAKIFAFEPIPPVFEVLRLNASIYDNDENIKLFQYGISNGEAAADFTYYPNATVLSGQFADEREEKKNVEAFMKSQVAFEQEEEKISGSQLDELLKNRLRTERFSCQLKTLSQVIREHRVEKIDLLKIDVEKGEIDVLKGIEEEHWGKILQIVLEIHNVDNRLESVTDMLKTRGYEVTFEQEEELQDTDLYNIFARLPGPRHERQNKPVKTNDTWTSAGMLTNDLQESLKDKLPGYMIPAFFMFLEKLPITANGKIDWKALPEPEKKSTGRYVAPQNETEKMVADIWKVVLNLDRVGANDNFFDVGGTSISIIQVNNRLRKAMNRNIPAVAMFEYPTIRTFSDYLEQLGEKGSGKTPGEDNAENYDLIGDDSLSTLDQTMKIIKEGQND